MVVLLYNSLIVVDDALWVGGKLFQMEGPEIGKLIVMSVSELCLQFTVYRLTVHPGVNPSAVTQRLKAPDHCDVMNENANV